MNREPHYTIHLLLDSRTLGGIETHVLQLAKGLQKMGHHPRVVFLTDYGPHPLQRLLQQADIQYCTLGGSFTALWRHLHQSSSILLHTHGYKAGIMGRIAARLLHLPVLSTFHAGEIPKGRLALYDWIDRHSAPLAHQRFCVSQEIATRLSTHADVMDNFVETHSLASSQGEEIAFVGRLSREKGADRFLQLAALFPKQRFHIYGEGPLRTSLERDASNNIHFHGQQTGMERVWPRIGLLLMPSRHEGLPMAALEAMARGIPVLASAVGALDQLINHNQNGWLTPSGDLKQIRTHLQQWISLPAQQKSTLQEEARNTIEQRFSTQVAIPKLIAHYQQAVAICNAE
ncbi:MAG: glycosyltransferase family 4 protein [Gammaproteobacteria bacterium]|jgi:hypothetical protein|nr:glycosyltransferase family 4 protein [Gammaproteobacteria bacterium]MBT4606952.1 glycosyltransferase family 4 protein [Thiotrichales bacterium]MBT3471306.1 glycosyltransferase family 4 protein [Gammaproteobacteria bacterium]MBT3968671.1 glycosyltransferase family 4 protein [Gammaproteobacteria bacterium]MBT4080259.1 glycosyltransferase family 4 protein [Gammaproteobacteria bacterium]